MGTFGSSRDGGVDVDMVDAETPQRIAEEILHRGRPRIVAGPISFRIAQRPEFDADHHAAAVPAGKRLGD